MDLIGSFDDGRGSSCLRRKRGSARSREEKKPKTLELDEVLNVGPMPLGYPAGGQKSTGSGAPRRGRASLPSLASTSTLRAAKAWRPAGYS